jgi:uncharacterized protein (DUF1697 family)
MIHICLLRAVNVAGKGMVAMADLREMVSGLGMAGETLLQSGNLLIEGASFGGAELEAVLESETEKRLGLRTDFFARSTGEWDALIKANPFTREAKRDPGHLLLMTLKSAPEHAAVAALKSAIKGRETVAAVGRQLYAVYPDGVGRSKLTIGLIEKTLATRGTGRNWNTVLKLQARAKALAG